MTHHNHPSGFSLVEVMVAMIILTVGVLALGASTGHVMAQIQASDLRTERMTVVRQATETLRGTAWDALETACAGALPGVGTGHYSVSCTVAQPATNLKWVELVTTGPGFQGGQYVPSVMESTSISIAEPVGP